MFERFTPEGRRVLSDARAHAARLYHDWIGCEHLLLAVAGSDTPAGRAWRQLGITPAAVEGAVRSALGPVRPGLDRDALAAIGIDLDAVRDRIEAVFGPGALARSGPAARPDRRLRRLTRGRWISGPRVDRTGPCRPALTPRAKKCLAVALRQATTLGDRHVGVEHLGLALASMEGGMAPRVLTDLGVAREVARRAIVERDHPPG
jgi:ATP-dependent Clp protease ATP-binding subunit ClpA